MVEPGLVTKLVDDVAGQPGALPLLSTALLELWQHRDGRRMRLAAYERTGGVEGAVARLAEDALRTPEQEEQRVARRILLRLAGPRRATRSCAAAWRSSELDAGDDGRPACSRCWRRVAS